MEVTHKRSLGETLYLQIDKNSYLNKLYAKLLINFSKKSLNIGNDYELLTNKELCDLLNFADILSMSTLPKKSGKHKIWAQQIITFINFLYSNSPNSNNSDYNKLIDFYLSRVFNNCSNYEAINKQQITYNNISITDSLYDFSKKDFLKIPNDDKYFIFEQKLIYDELEKGNLSYSAPTSMGKSFIMRIFIKNKVKNHSTDNFVIIVPTKALINEFKRKILNELKDILNISNYRLVTSAGDIVLEQDHHFIFIMTPERLLYLINTKPSIEINYLFIDEAHKICSNDARSSFYYQIVNSLSKRERQTLIYFSSPNIPNPDIYKDLIPSRQLNHIITHYSPVNQISYSIDTENKVLKLYNDHSENFIKLPLPSEITTLNSLIKHITTENKQTLVYSNSVDKIIRYAKDYSDTISPTNDKELISIANDVEKQIHKDYYLVSLLKKGVAFHVGYLPSSIKYRIEKAFINGKIKVIFCTSTLLEGVNLPADNLIITSYKNGKDKLTSVGFKNLIGRVGRLEYSMFGNVFLYTTNEEKKSLSNFENMLTDPIKDQQLSVHTMLNKKQKQQVITSVLSDDKTMVKQKETTYDEYNFMIKMGLLIVDNIRNNHADSLVVNSFITNNKQEIIKKINDRYKNEPMLDTLDLTFDQYRNIKIAIEKGLSYPDLLNHNGKMLINFKKTKPFLELLYKIFRWDIYENKNVANTELIGYYASILNQWMSGYGMSYILEKSLEYKKEHSNDGIYSSNRKVKNYYEHDNKHDRNLVIAEVLNILEHTIIFTFGNYFRIFTTEYKKQHNISETERLENDWYEYVEYGTINSKMIELQRVGYSRESSNIILNQKNKYIKNIPNKTISFSLSKNDLLNCNDDGVKLETNDIFINTPEIFF